jgi:multiple sugar transport system substrate-binding protein
MKKLLFIFLALVVVSCSEKEEHAGDAGKIVFWHFWSEPNHRKVLKEIINGFEQEYDCKVETVELSWSDGKTKLFAAFNSATAPDVLELGSDWVAQFSSAGVLEKLTDEEANLSQYVEFSTAPSIWKDSVYALPWIVDTRVLFVNKDLINQVGIEQTKVKNTKQLLENAEKVNAIDGIYGYGATGSGSHMIYKKIVSLFWTYGGTILDSFGKPVINSEQNVKALESYVRLSQNGLIETQRQLESRFAEGKLGYWVSGGWLLEKIKNENPSLNFEVQLLPGIGDNLGTSFAGGEYLAISNSTGNRELAVKFIKYMTAGENAIKFSSQIIEAGFPADKNYYNDEFYQSHPNRLVFANQLNHAKMTPVHPKWLDIEAIIEEAAVEALYGKKTSKQSLEDAQAKLKLIIK